MENEKSKLIANYFNLDESYSEESLRWALINELNIDEVVTIMAKFSEERIEQIIGNLKDANK